MTMNTLTIEGRQLEELAGVTQGIPATRIAAQRTFHDRFENVVFLEVEKQ